MDQEALEVKGDLNPLISVWISLSTMGPLRPAQVYEEKGCKEAADKRAKVQQVPLLLNPPSPIASPPCSSRSLLSFNLSGFPQPSIHPLSPLASLASGWAGGICWHGWEDSV